VLAFKIVLKKSMDEIEVVSFDAEGTLVTPDFSYGIWYEAIPELYARREGIEFERARDIVSEEYQKVGSQRLEWYDIGYWFSHFDLGAPDPVIERFKRKVRYYPEVHDVLLSLNGRYKLIVASGTPMELLPCLLHGIESYFANIFSSISHYGQLKEPDFYFKVCRSLEIQPNQVVHIGDNWQFDFLNARQAGIRAFHLDRKREAGHQHSLTDLAQLKFNLISYGG